MAANIIWKSMNAWCGMVAAYPGYGAGPTPRKPAHSNPPMMPPRSGPKARLYPKSTHCSETTQRTANDCMSVASTFFCRTIPP